MTKITRRDFIGATSASAAGMVVMPNIAEVFGSSADMDLFKHLPTVPFGAVFPEIEPAAGGLGGGLPRGGEDRDQRVPPLVHVVGHRGCSRQI